MRGDAVRPTQDMVRQALFSSLASRIPGARVLDLFAGSGAVGLEAWSRGAACVRWVEADGRVFRVLEDNLTALCGAARGSTPEQAWGAIRGDVFRVLERMAGTEEFDMVFADPPYDRGGAQQWAARLLETLATTGLLAPGGVFIMEQARDEATREDPRWTLMSSRAYGGTKLTYYQRATS